MREIANPRTVAVLSEVRGRETLTKCIDLPQVHQPIVAKPPVNLVLDASHPSKSAGARRCASANLRSFDFTVDKPSDPQT